MNKSDDIKDLVTALVKAHLEFKDIHKNKKSYNNEYADLSAIREGIEPALLKHGLVLIQEAKTSGEEIAVKTYLFHSSGQFVSTKDLRTAIGQNRDMGKHCQAVGSAITYFRRYQAEAFFFLKAEDDDGNAAKKQQEKSLKNKSNQSSGQVDVKVLFKTRIMELTDNFQDTQSAIDIKKKIGLPETSNLGESIATANRSQVQDWFNQIKDM